ncbi:MAG: ATP-binding cassette domain-containing protein [Oscillospiraceae bacterium]|nr:ATP-binding cassette domain-containing protein [Oscillospiraceae bacterium]
MLFQLEGVKVQEFAAYSDLEIQAGRVTFLAGASGTGKSTLLRLLNGMISATAGTVRYLGKPIEEYDPVPLRREVLLVGQSVYLFDKSIRENFEMYYAYRDLPAPSEETMRHYLDLCAGPFPLDSVCNLLSGGERQRVFLAICLSLGPKVLLLDEPTSALDDNTSTVLMERVTAYCKKAGITLIVVSHDSALAARFAEETITLGGGAS